jgi:outer membrane cobalamin receptor
LKLETTATRISDYFALDRMPPRLRLFTFFTLLILSLASSSVVTRASRLGGAENAGASISGYVRDKATGETLVGVNIHLKGTTSGGMTNKGGWYMLGGLSAGEYTLEFSYLGYKRKAVTVALKASESRRVDVELEEDAVELGEVVVQAERSDDRHEVAISSVNIPVKQLSQLRIGGESDVFRSIQFLPGVLASSQISSGLYIRGGSPDQTLVLLDGSTVYNPTHLFGFFSTFNPEAVKDVELIKGGYPAEYGGRMSAVLDLVQRDGNRNEIEGMASLGLIASRMSLQGPVGNGSWFIGGRRTYIDYLTNMFSTPADPLPDYYFYDANAKITQDVGANDRLSLSGFTGRDEMVYNTNAAFKTQVGIDNIAASSRWTHLFDERLFSTVTASWSRYENNFRVDQSSYSSLMGNSIEDLTLKAQMEWLVSDLVTVKTGLEASRYSMNFLQNWTGNADSAIAEGTTTGGALNITAVDHVISGYAQASHSFGPLLTFQAGLRANWYEMRQLATFDPRLALRWQIQDYVALKAAWGIYHQYFRLASVPDFSFFDTWLPTDNTVDPARAMQYVLGVETRPVQDVEASVEVYYKALTNISELNQYSTNSTTVRDLFYMGNGQAYGVEFFVQKRAGRFTGWVGYALGYITSTFEQINDGVTFRPKWDRRHDVKTVAQYRISDRWDVSATFMFQSGQSYTGQTSRLASYLPGENIGKGVTVPAQRYGLRLPPSHQLNLNASYHTTLFGLPTSLLLDVYNVYSHRDIWFRTYDTRSDITVVRDVRLLPILPTIAIEVKF